MGTVLSISSQVVHGAVGNSAAVPALAGLGHEVWPLPTIILSNHPAHGETARQIVKASDLAAMAARLEGHGWLKGCDCVLTGYFAEAGQVEAAQAIVARVKALNPRSLHACDPILGDEPEGLYVPEAVAAAIRDRLMPLADIATPNLFELKWLTGAAADDLESALRAAGTLGVDELLLTSLPEGAEIATAALAPGGSWRQTAARRTATPKGTGDLLCGLYLGHRLNGEGPETALSRAHRALHHVLAENPGGGLDLAGSLAAALMATGSDETGEEAK